jgi:hypothetical protein
VEATCQVAVEVRDYYGVRITPDEPCGAPIPRLDEGPCEAPLCGMPADLLIHAYGATMGHTYIGPLASECTRGHPVAVPSEAERRG